MSVGEVVIVAVGFILCGAMLFLMGRPNEIKEAERDLPIDPPWPGGQGGRGCFIDEREARRELELTDE